MQRAIAPTDDHRLETSAGDIRLVEYRLRQNARQWTVLHAGAVLDREDESRVICAKDLRLPYGVSLWPSAIALAHEIAIRSEEFSNQRVLELGSGIGLPGIVAASLGGKVTQTDRDELALDLCKRNGDRNQVSAIEYHLADWTAWENASCYDWIIGSDILYGEALHPFLRRIFESNLATNGRMLIADPFRSTAFSLLEALEAEHWRVTFSQWDVGEAVSRRPIGVFELSPGRRD